MTPMSPMSLLVLLANRMNDMQQSLDARARLEDVRDEQVTRLYDELDSYKRGAQDERMLALARGMFLVLDKLDPDAEGTVPLSMIRDELLDCLAAVGIEPIDGVPGTLDARSETVIGFLEDTPFGGDDRRVVSEGYRLDDRIVRPRRVLVRRGVAA